VRIHNHPDHGIRADLHFPCAPKTIIEACNQENGEHPVVIFFPGEYSHRCLTVVSYHADCLA